MSNDAGTDTGNQGTDQGNVQPTDQKVDQGNSGGDSGYTPPATQADLDRIIGERLARERGKYADYEDLKTRVAEFDTTIQAKDADLSKLTTDLEGATTRISELESALAAKDSEIAQRDFETAKQDIARDKGVPVEMLTGTTREELEASAEALAKWRDEITPKPRKSLRSGANLRDDVVTARQKAVLALRNS